MDGLQTSRQVVTGTENGPYPLKNLLKVPLYECSSRSLQQSNRLFFTQFIQFIIVYSELGVTLLRTKPTVANVTIQQRSGMFYLPPSLKFVAGIDIPVDSVPLGKAWWTRLLLLLALLAKHRLITAQCLRVWKYKWHKKNQVANKHYHAQCSHTESNLRLSSFLSDLKSRLKGGISDNIPTNLESQTYYILMECNIY